MRANEFVKLNENAVGDLEKDLKNPHSYDAIDHMMQSIAKKHGITGKELHDRFVKKHGQVPDDWIKDRVTENFADGNSIDMAEGAQNNLPTIIQSFVNSSLGQKYKQYDCKTVTRAFVQWAEQNKIPTQVVSLAPPSADFIAKNPKYKGKSGQGDGHIMPIVNGNAIDFTVRQFGVSRPFDNPLVTPTNSLPAVYGRFGYFTDKPEWFLGGKSHWIGPLSSIPSEIFNQNFGDEMLEQGVAENFADGKVKGKSRPGRVKRAGASCNGSVTDLRKRAKNASGEKARMYHWCANMKSGKKKK
jgi:hypothetical protein